MVKTVFESDVSLRNYREKTEEIKVDACMSAFVSYVSLVSAYVSWKTCSRKGFYAAMNWFSFTQPLVLCIVAIFMYLDV
jgi:hypothetical protein